MLTTAAPQLTMQEQLNVPQFYFSVEDNPFLTEFELSHAAGAQNLNEFGFIRSPSLLTSTVQDLENRNGRSIEMAALLLCPYNISNKVPWAIIMPIIYSRLSEIIRLNPAANTFIWQTSQFIFFGGGGTVRRRKKYLIC